MPALSPFSLSPSSQALKMAVKIVDKTNLEPWQLKRLRQSVSALQLVKHAHVSQLLQLVEHENEVHIYLEHSSSTLLDYIKQRGHLSTKTARYALSHSLSPPPHPDTDGS